MSRLDFCNSLLVGTLEKNLVKIQKLQRLAARLVVRLRGTGAGHSCVIYSTAAALLPIRQRIQFKICVFVFSCLHGDAPPYLMDLLLHLRMREPRLHQPTDL